MKIAMNTIPIIFNENITPYTAVGGKEHIGSSGITAVVLNRSPLVRRSFFQEIEKTGFDTVISVESSAPHYDIEELAGRFPFVRFIIPEREINIGEQINLAASETQSALFFVIRSDMKIIIGGTARRIAERLKIIPEEKNEKIICFKRLCTVPILMNSNYEIFPSIVTPATQKKKMHKRSLQPIFIEPKNEGDCTLYPFDGIGIYDKQRFIEMGGYDVSIKKLHWQLMDFGFRAHLWGEQIALSINLKLSYEGELPVENSSIEESYRRFYLKNLAPIIKNNYNQNKEAHLPFYRFFSFMKNSGEDIFSAWKEFKESRRWVNINKNRWICDARELANKWSLSV